MKVIQCDTKQEASVKACEILCDVIQNKKDPILGLATGSTPLGLYDLLVKKHQSGLSFAHVQSVNLDEYAHLPKSHPESYYSFMHTNLFNHIDMKEDNIHLPNGDTNDLEKACDDYNALLSKLVADVQVLGIGANGHIGFNEPNTPFNSKTHIVDLHEKTRQDNARFFDNNIDLVPKQAITMGIENIMASKKIVLLAFGENKADAVAKMVNGPVDESLPASILQKHSDVVILVDKQAGSKL